MSEPELRSEEVATALIETRRRPSIVWLIPLVAALAGGFVAWRALSERGPDVTIRLADADGLEAGKTRIRYKNVEVGLVQEVRLAEDLSGVVVHARMARGADRYLREGTRFWVVRARVSGAQVSGLGTLFSGAYIGMDPVLEGAPARTFVALDAPPVVTSDQPGRHFVLRSLGAGAVEVGAPVFFRKVHVGEVVASALDPSGDFVTMRVFVRAPFDERVRVGTRFWNASGLDVTVGAEGVQIDTDALVSLLIGGIAFDSPDDGAGARAAAEAVFPLYANRAATREQIYTQRSRFLLHFDQSVRGLAPGSPVEFRGIHIGRVVDVRLEPDPSGGGFRIPVVIEIEPERIGPLPTLAEGRAALEALVARGMRAQLARGNLLTGQLLVSLDMHWNASPARIVWDGPHPELPTIPTPVEEITEGLTELVERLERIPFDELSADLQRTLATAEGALAQARETMVGTRALVGPDSTVTQELRRALVELREASRALGLAAEQIEREPSSLLFGKGSD